jgi:GNAT superfamily N-acetyltransferase
VAEAVRPAQRADADAVAELCQQGLTEAQAVRGGALLVRRELDVAARAMLRPGGLERLATDPRRTVLVGTLDEVGGTSLAVVDFCYVEPAARSVGIGAALLDAAVSWAAQGGCRGIDVPALPGDRAAKQWLETAGFRARALLMHRTLP